MSQQLNVQMMRKAVCAVVAAMFVITCTGMAFAEDDDEDGLLPDQKFFRTLMRGLGLRNGGEAQIEYKERPPLVVPPSRNLPAPVTSSPTERNPAWPVDPDVQQKAAAKKAKAERKPVIWEKEGDVLKPSELEAGKTSNPPLEQPAGAMAKQMSPNELGYVGGLWADFKAFGDSFKKDKPPETAKFVREPRRAALTDPPTGYRTPSPDQPYGIHLSREKIEGQAPDDRQVSGTTSR